MICSKLESHNHIITTFHYPWNSCNYRFVIEIVNLISQLNINRCYNGNQLHATCSRSRIPVDYLDTFLPGITRPIHSTRQYDYPLPAPCDHCNVNHIALIHTGTVRVRALTVSAETKMGTCQLLPVKFPSVSPPLAGALWSPRWGVSWLHVIRWVVRVYC